MQKPKKAKIPQVRSSPLSFRPLTELQIQPGLQNPVSQHPSNQSSNGEKLKGKDKGKGKEKPVKSAVPSIPGSQVGGVIFVFYFISTLPGRVKFLCQLPRGPDLDRHPA
jgi:hypothetical protein